MTAALVLRGGDVVDHTGRRRADVAIDDVGMIIGVDEHLDGVQVLDVTDCLILPGFVDVATETGEPGHEEAETVETAARAAAAGGYTCIGAAPGTAPPVDSVAVANEMRALGRGVSCEVVVTGCLTVGAAGKQLAPLGELSAAGVRFFTDGGNGVQDGRLLRRALEYASSLGVVIGERACSDELGGDGHMDEGEWSTRLGIPGQPAEAEEVMIMRDLALARLTGCRMHFRHVSTSAGLAMIAAAREAGVAVTCDLTPAHLSLTAADCAGYDTAFKLLPPLRTEADVAALRSSLVAGRVDAVSSGHRPCPPEAKEQSFEEAAPGAVGLETTAGVLLTQLPELDPTTLATVLSHVPARLLGVEDRHGGPIATGRPANLCVLDPEQHWTVDTADFHSKSRNTPFAGHALRGRIRHTILEGSLTLENGVPTR